MRYEKDGMKGYSMKGMRKERLDGEGSLQLTKRWRRMDGSKDQSGASTGLLVE